MCVCVGGGGVRLLQKAGSKEFSNSSGGGVWLNVVKPLDPPLLSKTKRVGVVLGNRRSN